MAGEEPKSRQIPQEISKQQQLEVLIDESWHGGSWVEVEFEAAAERSSAQIDQLSCCIHRMLA